MNLPKIITGLLLISIVAGSSWAQSSTANWYSALPAAAAGSPWTLEVLSSSSSGSRLLLECPGFWSEQIFQDGQFRSKVYLPGSAGSTTSIGLPELPSIGRLLAIPADRDVDVIIHEISTQTFPCENPCLSESSEGTNQVPLEPLQQAGVFPSVWASASPPVIMKDYRLAPIVLNPIRYDFDAKQLVVATRLEVEFRTAELSDQNVKTYFPPASEAFRPIYEGVILDQTEYNTATPLVAEGSRGKYLIFIAENLTNSFFLNNFMTWKRQLGYQVILKPLTTANNGKEQIKAAIMEEYYAGDAQLDYVLLVGDPNNGVVTIPAFDIYKPPNNTEVDPTDHSYALLEGQDYFPDVMVGRLSITSTIELSIALNKILSYQKNPYLTDPNWFKKALLAAGNYSDTPPAPITPAWVTLWLMDKLHDYGYTQVDTVIYWGPPQNPAFGTPLIASSINSGVGLVAYRGWGDESGWQYPIFQIPHLAQLQNGFKLPLVVSIVCETGNFRDTVDPCFGEAWIRLGTPVTPAGGVSVYAPSDLHTNTRWNNAIYAGFFEGLISENLYRLGQSVVRSKLELFYGFPEDIASDGLVNFYFHTYNILGDPELPIWTDTPALMALEIPDQIQPGSQMATARLTTLSGTPLGGAYIAFYKANEVLAGAVADGNGEVSVLVEPLTEGQLYVTASKQNYKAKQDSITVQIGSFPLGIGNLSVSGDGVAQAGENFDLTVQLHNYGTTAISDIEAVLQSNHPGIAISDSTAVLASLAGSSDGNALFQATADPEVMDGAVVEFTLALSSGANSNELKFILPIGGLMLVPAEIVVESGSLEPGETAAIKIRLTNIGILPAQSLTGVLSCASSTVSITSAQTAFPVLLPNATGLSSSCEVAISTEAATGQQVIFELALTASGGYTQTVSFPVSLGQPGSTDPLGPDSYGYYAYDNTDVDYPEAPVYDWIELDPASGGSGATLHALGDDQTVSLELPFPFMYYGEDYDSLTICSNGYVSFGETWMAEFRNWNMPSALGPPALIAPFWDDLKADTMGLFRDTSDHIRVYTRYDAGEGRFAMEWSGAVNRFQYVNPSLWKEETFELILFDPVQHPTLSGDGEILFMYETINDVDDENNYATAGMEDYEHRRGLQYAYSGDYPPAAAILADGRAIKITTDPPGAVASGHQGQANLAPTLEALPNPANPNAVIRFSLPEAGNVLLEIFNTMGQRIAVLENRNLVAGLHRRELRGEALASGIYIAVLRHQQATVAQKILILK